jgi:hypothetical protein
MPQKVRKISSNNVNPHSPTARTASWFLESDPDLFSRKGMKHFVQYLLGRENEYGREEGGIGKNIRNI